MAKRYLGENGFVSKWSTAHHILENVRKISGGRDLAAAVDAVGGVIEGLGYASFLLLRFSHTERDKGWRVIAGSPIHGVLHADAERPVPRANEQFRHSRWRQLPRRRPAPVDAERENGLQVLIRHLSDSGVTSVTAVYSRPRRRLGGLGLFACGTGDAEVHKALTPENTPLLKAVLSTLAEARYDEIVADAVLMPKGEQAVLRAFADGRSPAEIALERSTSVRTIRNQLENARRRLGARSNTHAVAIAIEMAAIPISLGRST